MTNFFTSDHHFFHKNIIKYCNRPFKDVSHMNEIMIQRWNEKVTPEDKVYVIGDFSFGKPAETKSVYDRLNGYKILIRGNHDNRHTCKLFDEVHDNLTLKIGGEEILLSHYPYEYKENDISGQDVGNGHLNPTPNKGQWLLHGHVHDLWRIIGKKKMLNVGGDMWDFIPLSESKVIDYIDSCKFRTEWWKLWHDIDV